MTETIGRLFGGGSDRGSSEALRQQLAAQESSQRTALASSINSDAAASQDLARGSRRRGGRQLLTYLGEEGQTLG